VWSPKSELTNSTAVRVPTELRAACGTAAAVAANHGIEAPGLDRFTLGRRQVEGLLLGFAAFDEREICRGIVTLAGALERGASSSKVRSAAPLANLATSRKTRG
jgi:hypothetical protein